MHTRSITLSTRSKPSSNGLINLFRQQVNLRQIKRLGQEIIDCLIRDDESKTTQPIHINRNVWWIVYDPCLNQYITRAAEAEVRFWLETRYR